MVSDSELIARLREFLRESDLNTTTTTIVRRKLEEDFGVDLSEKKKFIREQVDLYLQSQFENAAEGGDGENEEDDQTAKLESEVTDGSDANEEDEDNDDDNEDDGGGGFDNEGASSGKKRSEGEHNEGKKKATGFNKLCSLSPQLQEFLGVPALARTEVVKQTWAYIREQNLQDTKNRKTINCDEKLEALFGVKSIDMFQMNKALSEHIWPLDSDAAPEKSAKKEKQRRKEREKDSDRLKRKEKRQKVVKAGTGFLAPLQLSDALVKFLGTGESELPRTDVIKRMWDYIKENNLQDPNDKRKVICDEKLKELFEVDSFTGFTVSKLLSAHFIKS